MFELRKRAYAMLLILLLVPAGCQNPTETASRINDSTPQPASNPPADKSHEQPVATAPSSGTMGKVTAVRLASAESGWVGGEGWIARTDDGGKNWNNQYLGNGTISQIFALNGQDAWAVTDKASLLGTSDGGTHWEAAGTVPNKGFLHFVSKNEAFSANARTADGGSARTTPSLRCCTPPRMAVFTGTRSTRSPLPSRLSDAIAASAAEPRTNQKPAERPAQTVAKLRQSFLFSSNYHH